MDIFFNHWLKNTELVQRLKRVALILPFSGICFNDNWRILLFKYCDAPGSVLICVEERSVGDTTEDRTPSFKLLLFSQIFCDQKMPELFSLSSSHQPPSKQTHMHRGKELWDPFFPFPFTPRPTLPLQSQVVQSLTPCPCGWNAYLKSSLDKSSLKIPE